MAITIQGIRLDGVTLNKEDGKEKITGSYELMSSTDTVLAKQAFNGYSSMVVNWSPETLKLLRDFKQAVQRDITLTLGLE